jgi:hemoglobin-like flavoprotein
MVRQSHIWQLTLQTSRLLLSSSSTMYALRRDAVRVATFRAHFSPASDSLHLSVQSFYGLFFLLAPEVRPMFKRGMAVQGRMMANVVNFIVNSATKTDEQFVSVLTHLAISHNQRNIQAAHYSTMGIALISALRQCCGETIFHSRAHRSWVLLFSRMMSVIIPLVVLDVKTHDPADEARYNAIVADSAMPGRKHVHDNAAKTANATPDALAAAAKKKVPTTSKNTHQANKYSQQSPTSSTAAAAVAAEGGAPRSASPSETGTGTGTGAHVQLFVTSPKSPTAVAQQAQPGSPNSGSAASSRPHGNSVHPAPVPTALAAKNGDKPAAHKADSAAAAGEAETTEEDDGSGQCPFLLMLKQQPAQAACSSLTLAALVARGVDPTKLKIPHPLPKEFLPQAPPAIPGTVESADTTLRVVDSVAAH